LGVESTLPLVHSSETLTVAALFGEKSLLTVNVAPLSVFVIVQDGVPPSLIDTVWQLDSFLAYPDGAVPSVAEQVAPTAKPVTVNTAGEASDAFFGDESTLPVVHVSETLTVAASFGTKSLLTVNVADRRVFVIVQDGVPPALIATIWQPASFLT
jgi:hypothetical protein